MQKRKPSAIFDAKVRKRILSLSEAVMVRICRLLETAAVHSIQPGEEHIQLASLSEELITKTLVSMSDRRSRRAAN